MNERDVINAINYYYDPMNMITRNIENYFPYMIQEEDEEIEEEDEY